jgi:hypothetical protein
LAVAVAALRLNGLPGLLRGPLLQLLLALEALEAAAVQAQLALHRLSLLGLRLYPLYRLQAALVVVALAGHQPSVGQARLAI